jgi:hypothetical protein
MTGIITEEGKPIFERTNRVEEEAANVFLEITVADNTSATFFIVCLFPGNDIAYVYP